VNIVETLSSIPLFLGLPENQLVELSRIVVDKRFKRGDIIFSEGDEGIGFYIVISGKIKIYKISPDGKEQILHILGAGEPFGEIALMGEQFYPAHAEAMDKSRIFFFPKVPFASLIKQNPSLALNMIAILFFRLHEFTVMIESLSLKDVPTRLADYLIYLSERNGGVSELKLDIPKTQLANLLGTIPETLSRIFAKMTKQGLIKTDGPNIKILDYHALKELSTAEKRLSDIGELF